MMNYLPLFVLFLAVLNLGDCYSKYGRTCNDIGCPSNFECVLDEDPCPRNRQRDCGSYPTCKRISNNLPTCATYICPSTQVCRIQDGHPNCFDSAGSGKHKRDTESYNSTSSNHMTSTISPVSNFQKSYQHPYYPNAPTEYPGYPQNPSYPQNPNYPQNPSHNPNYPQNPGYNPNYTSSGIYPSLPSVGTAYGSTTSRPYVHSQNHSAQPGYYPSGQTTSRPNAYQPGGYPTQTGSYPSYPTQSGGGYPSYPSGQTTSRPGGYPTQTGGYPSYPTQSGGYPSQSGGYPSQSGGYPSQSGGYPGYPRQPTQQQGGGYPNYPSQGGYSTQQGGSYPNYPSQGGYPTQQGGGYPNQGRYPTQQGGYTSYPNQGYQGYQGYSNQGYGTQGYSVYPGGNNPYPRGYNQNNQNSPQNVDVWDQIKNWGSKALLSLTPPK